MQAANTVINVDLPWNPAVLEQRIARAHRMGQKQEVQVFVLVTEETIEENLLATIAAKKDLALAALDVESEIDQVDFASGMEELKSRLEVLLGARPEAPVDESVKQAAEASTRTVDDSHRDRVAAAGGELLGAAFKFLGELVAQNGASALRRDWSTTCGPVWAPASMKTPAANRDSRSRCPIAPRSTIWLKRWPRCWPPAESRRRAAPAANARGRRIRPFSDD